MVGQEELESSTSAVSERHSNQLNYWPIVDFWFRISDFWFNRHKPSARRKSAISNHKSAIRRDIQTVVWIMTVSWNGFLYKGGDPAAPSGTATLLWLNPNHQPHRRRRRPCGSATDFGWNRLSWFDRRCVQDPGTYSPLHSDQRLLAIPTSCPRVAEDNLNWDVFLGLALRCRIATHC